MMSPRLLITISYRKFQEHKCVSEAIKGLPFAILFKSIYVTNFDVVSELNFEIFALQ